MEFDLSSQFNDDSSLDDIEQEINSFSQSDINKKGEIYLKVHTQSPVMKYEINGSLVDIHLTDFGKKLLTTNNALFLNVDAITFSQFLGAGGESQADLKKKCGLLENEMVFPENVLKMAIESRNLIVTPENAGPGKSKSSVEKVPLSEIIDERKRNQLSEISSKNIIKYGTGRQISGAFLKSADQLHPVIVKSASKSVSKSIARKEEFMISLEYAALKAMRNNGMNAVPVKIMKDDENRTYLIEGRFDSPTRKIISEEEADVVVTPSNEQIQYFSAATQKTVQAGSFQNLTPQMTAFYMSKVLESSKSASRQFITSRIVNFLIGNADNHGINTGLIKTVLEDGSIKVNSCPFFDVTPSLFEGELYNVPVNAGLKGMSLGKLELNDILRMDHHLKREFDKNQELVSECFIVAKNIQNEMTKIINEELVKDGIISSVEAMSFDKYLNSEIGYANLITEYVVSTSPFKEKPAMHSFAKKVALMSAEQDIETQAMKI